MDLGRSCPCNLYRSAQVLGTLRLTWPPSHDTFSAVFRHLDPDAFAQVFGRFAAKVGAGLAGPRTIAIDGKAMRHAVEKGKHAAPCIMVTAWAAEARLSLAAQAATKGNETAAALKLLTYLDLCEATSDAASRRVRRNGPPIVIAKL